jgi:hypothetical protein
MLDSISLSFEEERKEANQRMLMSAIITCVITGIMLLLFLIKGYTYLDPPLAQTEGLTVALGLPDAGLEDEPAEYTAGQTAAGGFTSENFLTQDNDEDVPVKPSSENPTNNNSDNTNQNNNNQNNQQVNPAWDVNWGNNNTNSGDGGNPGNQGDLTGVPGGDPHGQGMGNGVRAYLGNRNHTNTIKPQCRFEENGIVVVKIKVNRDGKVTSAEPVIRYKRKDVTLVSTATHKTNQECARQNAYKITFKANPDAPEEQEGAVTFEFKLK